MRRSAEPCKRPTNQDNILLGSFASKFGLRGDRDPATHLTVAARVLDRGRKRRSTIARAASPESTQHAFCEGRQDRQDRQDCQDRQALMATQCAQ